MIGLRVVVELDGGEPAPPGEYEVVRHFIRVPEAAPLTTTEPVRVLVVRPFTPIPKPARKTKSKEVTDGDQA